MTPGTGNPAPVVVTGIGVLCAIGCTREQFWHNLVAGVSGVRRISAFEPEGHMSQIAAEIGDFDQIGRAHV